MKLMGDYIPLVEDFIGINEEYKFDYYVDKDNHGCLRIYNDDCTYDKTIIMGIDKTKRDINSIKLLSY